MAAQVLSIIGMHRSGTSLTARYMHEAGLFLGFDVFGKNWSNPGGHFEDRDFMTLHNEILQAHHTDYTHSVPVDWRIDETVTARANAMIDARSTFEQWGWKDPRTSLFLPFWKNMIPGLHFVVVYRHYLPVVRSLISRDILLHRSKTSRLHRMMHPRFTQAERIALFDKYLRTWTWYYKEIIRHVLQDPGARYTIIRYDDLVRGDYRPLLELQKAGFRLNPPAKFNTSPKRAPAVDNIPVTSDGALIAEADEVDRYFSK